MYVDANEPGRWIIDFCADSFYGVERLILSCYDIDEGKMESFRYGNGTSTRRIVQEDEVLWMGGARRYTRVYLASENWRNFMTKCY